MEQLASIIENHMSLKPKNQPVEFLPHCASPAKSVLVPTTGITHGQRRRVDKRNPRTGALALAQVAA